MRTLGNFEVLAGFCCYLNISYPRYYKFRIRYYPDRSQQRFNTAINPVDWNFQVYLCAQLVPRKAGAAEVLLLAGQSNLVMLCLLLTWYMWQALVSNTSPSSGTTYQSAFGNLLVVSANRLQLLMHAGN